jgi:DNA-binding LacI/PurR family transcriptional regulator
MGKPFVQVGGKFNPNIPSVAFDQVHGVSQLMHHLHSLGHRQIAEIGGMSTRYDGRCRHQAFQEAMHSYQLSSTLSLPTEYFSLDNGYQCCKQLLEKDQKFTALVCGSDSIAVGAMHALWERGLRVPEDVSVVGYDDRDVSVYLNPPLTTVQQDLRLLYNEAINYLLARIEEKGVPHFQQVISPALVVRQSTAAPASTFSAH